MDVTLPHGVVAEGRVQRTVALRPLTGRDEEFLLHGGSMLPAMRDTAILAGCLVGPGDDTRRREWVRTLTSGDRQALLLHLCADIAGHVLEATVPCADQACGERLELSVDVVSLLDQPCTEAAETYDVVLGGPDGLVRVRLRLPDGALEEAAAALQPEDAERMLLEALVCDVSRDGERLSCLPEELREELAGAVERLDPLAETRLEVCCPSCGASSVAVLDPGDYLLQRVGADRDVFYGEVHRLASAYHWSESEILSLPVRKRRMYVDLVEAGAAGAWA